MTQTVLVIFLIVLVVILATILLIRIRSERRRLAAIARMDLEEFSDFLRTNCLEGSIQDVAGKVSDLLKHACGCEIILFLRKRRRSLDLNYFHGISRFDRKDLRTRYSDDLVNRLRGQVFPEEVSDLESYLPENLCRKLHEWKCDLYFPIFWRDHLYGLYFIRSSIETRTPSFKLLVAALAQSLSAAYHIRWHESKFGKLQDRVAEAENEALARAVESKAPAMGVLKLVRHRNSETLVGEIVEEMQKDIGLESMAFLYEPKCASDPLRIVEAGTTRQFEPPRHEKFADLVGRLSVNGWISVGQLKDHGAEAAAWGEKLQEAGLMYLSKFPLTEGRAGIMTWNDSRKPAEIQMQLRRHETSAGHLMENAVSFEKVEELSFTDNLTGLANRRYFLRRLEEEIDRAKRYQRSLGLIIFDLDELKSVNDRYGHQAGDAVIKRIGEVLRLSIRSIDVIARYGGDEFCVVMPESDRATCRQFMDRLQRKIVGSKFRFDQITTDLVFTISQGGAVFPDHGENSEQLIFAADMALLKAKEAGRNKYIVA
ncbi:MAG: GGDEF domain-containing protein [bacterium]|nr:GGDEF domain-containing protein [bacterium]